MIEAAVLEEEATATGRKPSRRDGSLNDVRAVIPERCYQPSAARSTLAVIQGVSLWLAPVVALVLFEDALALRVGGGPSLKPVTEKSGFIGDLKAKTFQALGEDKVPNYPTAWLPTSRVAERWQWLVTEKP